VARLGHDEEGLEQQPPAPDQPFGVGVPSSAPSRLPRGLSSLRHRNFRIFWIGQLISLSGTWMQQVAQAWLILQLTNDPVALGVVAAAQFGPVLVLGLFAGIVADAVNKRQALMVTQTASALLAVVLGILVATNVVETWHVFALAFLLGIVNSFDMPIRQAFVVEMVGREHIANAVALNSAVFNGARIVGPAIAGVVIATIGMVPLFFYNGLSYMAVVIGMALMRTEELVPLSARAMVERHWRSVLDHLVEGLRYVRATPEILAPILILSVVATFALNFTVLIPVYASNTLRGDADTFGFLMAASGVGSIAAALTIAFRGRPTMRMLLAGTTAVGLGMVGLGLSAWLPAGLLLMTLAGWGTIAMAATANTTIQLTTPDALRGRVMSVYTTVFAGSTPFGGLFAGTVAGLWGVQAALGAGGLIALLAAGYAVLWLRGRGVSLSR
jgi:MFS family permease